MMLLKFPFGEFCMPYQERTQLNEDIVGSAAFTRVTPPLHPGPAPISKTSVERIEKCDKASLDTVSEDLMSLFNAAAVTDVLEPTPINENNKTVVSEETGDDVIQLDRLKQVIEPELVTSLLSMSTTSSVTENLHTASNKGPAAANFSSAEVDMKLAKKSYRMGDSHEKKRYYHTYRWSKMFEELLQFKKESGHCRVPYKYYKNPVLAQWVKRQRYQYKLKVEGRESSMTEARIVALEGIDFEWYIHKNAWRKRFHELEEYFKSCGNCIVPKDSSEHPKLNYWIKYQRRQYMRLRAGLSSSLTKERIKALEKLGFEWEVKKKSKLSRA